jgi:hypothetical protein
LLWPVHSPFSADAGMVVGWRIGDLRIDLAFTVVFVATVVLRSVLSYV